MANRSEQVNTRIRIKQPEQSDQTIPKTDLCPARKMSLIAILGVALFFLFWISLLFIVPYRQFHLSPAWIFEHVQARFAQLYAFLTGASSDFGITVYQYLAVVLVGGALAACGCIFKGSFRNELAGPSTMGVMAGGTLGLLVYLLLFTASNTQIAYSEADLSAWSSRSLFDMYGQQLFTLLGCFFSMVLVLSVATAAGRGRLSASAMILSGTVLSTITGSISKLIQYYIILSDPYDPRIEAIRDLSMGSFNRINGPLPLVMMAVPILLCLAVLMFLRHKLNALSLSEDEALTIGVNIRRYRYLIIAVGTVMTAVIVSFCGHIGFLGYMIPLIGKKLVGPDMSKLLPVSVLLGAILLTVVFDLAYICGLTDYLNLFTSAIGGFTMLGILLGKGGAQHCS